MSPENKIPIKPENLKKICGELGLEGNVDDNTLIKEMDDLNLPGCKCENPLNQTILYMHMLYGAFIGKDNEKNDNEFENYQADGKKEIMNEALTYLGINNIMLEKKERLVQDEANSNNELINLNLHLLSHQKTLK